MTNELDAVIEAVISKRYDSINEKNKDPKLEVYMSYEFWARCMACKNPTGNNGYAVEFISSGTLLGFNVWRVINMNGEQHVRFRIVEV